VRKLVIDLIAPGLEGQPGLPDEAHFRYQEWWRRSSVGWVLVRYDYDYFDLLVGGRRGYHLHPLTDRGSVPHVVCLLPDGTGSGRHYAAHEIELLAAHEAFEAQYAAGQHIDCRGLRAIDEGEAPPEPKSCPQVVELGTGAAQRERAYSPPRCFGSRSARDPPDGRLGGPLQQRVSSAAVKTQMPPTKL
jgi:hypothetical protein